MKKVFRFLGIIAILAVIGFSMAACGGNDDDSGGGGGSSGGNTLSGTYYCSNGDYITFSSNGTWKGRYEGDSHSGTYRLGDLENNGFRTLYMRGDETWSWSLNETWTVENAKTISDKTG